MQFKGANKSSSYLKKSYPKNYSSVVSPSNDITPSYASVKENQGFSKLSASVTVEQPVNFNSRNIPEQ